MEYHSPHTPNPSPIEGLPTAVAAARGLNSLILETNSLMFKPPLLWPLSAILPAHTHLPDETTSSF